MGKIEDKTPSMGRIDALINELCPEGVEFVKLKQVCDFITGFAFKASLFSKEGKPICKTTNIQNNIIEFTEMEHFQLKDYDSNLDRYLIMPQDIVIGMSGTIKVGINNSSNKCYLNQRVGKFIPDTSVLNNRFLFQVLLKSVNILCDGIAGGSVKNLSNNDIYNLEIPLPPLPIQEAIVEILDNFSRLSAELQAELQARKQQYAYYRNQLLTRFAPDEPVREYALGELCDFRNGFAFKSSLFKTSGKKIIRITNITGSRVLLEDVKYFDDADYANVNLEPFKISKGNILIAMSGATTGKIGIYENKENAYLNQRVGMFIPKGKILNKYLYYILSGMSEEIYIMAGGGAQPNLSSKQLMEKVAIPLPSLSEQARIVSILDKFEALINDLSQGLPAEIEAVQKQYEYYRNKLLTFEPA